MHLKKLAVLQEKINSYLQLKNRFYFRLLDTKTVSKLFSANGDGDICYPCLASFPNVDMGRGELFPFCLIMSESETRRGNSFSAQLELSDLCIATKMEFVMPHRPHVCAREDTDDDSSTHHMFSCLSQFQYRGERRQECQITSCYCGRDCHGPEDHPYKRLQTKHNAPRQLPFAQTLFSVNLQDCQ